VLAQRLVRVLCKHCKQPDTSPTTEAIKAQIGIPANTTVYRAVGCRECRNTGYHGRHAIFEWMDIDNELRQLVLKNVSSGEIAAQAKRNGLRVLSEDGWRLVRAGVTTPEEVLRVTKDQSVSNLAPEAAPKPAGRGPSPKEIKCRCLITKRSSSTGASRRASWKRRAARRRFARWKASGCARSRSRRKPPRSAAKQAANATTDKGAGLRSSLGSGKISARDLENFTRLLSSLLAAGVPLSRALVILHKEASSPAAGAKWKEIHGLVIDGMSLADAMAKSPETFPRVYVAMVQAGETGGFLDLVLAQIADFQAREKDLRSKVLTAMLYPAILLVLALGVVVFLLVFFIPNFRRSSPASARPCPRLPK
jgi:hypothetical protein